MTATAAKKIRSRRIFAPALLLALACGAAACSDGYPTEDLVDGLVMDGKARVVHLNQVLDQALTSHVEQLLLPKLCLLRVVWHDERPALDYSLMQLLVTVKSDPMSGKSQLLIRPNRDSAQTAQVLFSTDDWVDLATFRSQMNLLRAACANSQNPPPV